MVMRGRLRIFTHLPFFLKFGQNQKGGRRFFSYRLPRFEKWDFSKIEKNIQPIEFFFCMNIYFLTTFFNLISNFLFIIYYFIFYYLYF